MKLRALIDSNVVVATLVHLHPHHVTSLAFFQSDKAQLFVAAHSYAEAFNTLTRQGPRAPFSLAPGVALQMIASIQSETTLAGLTPDQTVSAVHRFGLAGGIGARLFDHLIGEAAIAAGLTTIVTWNVRDFRALFPNLKIVTPAEMLA